MFLSWHWLRAAFACHMSPLFEVLIGLGAGVTLPILA